MPRLIVSVPVVFGAGDEVTEPSVAARSGATSSCGSTVIVLPGNVSHRNVIRWSLKKSRSL